MDYLSILEPVFAPHQVIMLVISFCFLLLGWAKPIFGKFNSKSFIVSTFGVALILESLGLFATVIAIRLGMLTIIDIKPEPQFDFQAFWRSFQVASTKFDVIMGAPISEELLFRVVLLGLLTKLLPKPAAIVIAALPFTLLHSSAAYHNLPSILLGGIALGVIYLRHGVFMAIIAHGFYNFINIVLLEPYMWLLSIFGLGLS